MRWLSRPALLRRRPRSPGTSPAEGSAVRAGECCRHRSRPPWRRSWSRSPSAEHQRRNLTPAGRRRGLPAGTGTASVFRTPGPGGSRPTPAQPVPAVACPGDPIPAETACGRVPEEGKGRSAETGRRFIGVRGPCRPSMSPANLLANTYTCRQWSALASVNTLDTGKINLPVDSQTLYTGQACKTVVNGGPQVRDVRLFLVSCPWHCIRAVSRTCRLVRACTPAPARTRRPGEGRSAKHR